MSIRLLKKILQDGKTIEYKQFQGIVHGALEEYELLLEAFNREEHGHIVVDRSTGEVVLANRTISKMMPRQSITKSMGKNILDAIKDKDIRLYIEKVLKGKIDYSDRDFSFGEGEIKTIRFSFFPFMLSDKEYLDIRVKDMTETLKKEMKLRSSESLASMTTMAAGVAHEIKNPLAAMKIYTSLLRKAIKSGKNMDKAEEFIDIIEDETERLNEIAVDFLFAVKPMDVCLKMDTLNEMITELADFVAVEASQKHIELVLKLDKFIPNLMIDRKLLRRAMLNLINNSFYAMGEKGGTLTIETRADGNFIQLIVQDTGCGMSEELQKRVFEPYYTTKNEKGTGLGLTALLKIVNAHSGEIALDSKEGVGTKFTIKLPVPVSERKVLADKKEK